MVKNVINFAAFYLGWMLCVIGAAHHHPWLGPLFVLLFLVWHLYQATSAGAELLFICIGVILGGIYEMLLHATGWVIYIGNPGLPPPWIMALWAIFCCTLNVSLRWMKQRYLMGVLFGLVGAPVSYWGAVRLGAVQFAPITLGLAAIGLGWGLLMPILLKLSNHFDGYAGGRELSR